MSQNESKNRGLHDRKDLTKTNKERQQPVVVYKITGKELFVKPIVDPTQIAERVTTVSHRRITAAHLRLGTFQEGA